MYQTSASPTLFISGGCVVSVQSSVGSTSYQDLGSAKGVKFSESFDTEDYEVGGIDLTHSIRNHTCSIECDLYEINPDRLIYIRGGLDSTATADTLKTGGLFVNTPRTWVLTNNGPTSSQSLTITVYSGVQAEPIKLEFPGDDVTDVASLSLKIKGYMVSTRTAGDQLYSIVDTRST